MNKRSNEKIQDKKLIRKRKHRRSVKNIRKNTLKWFEIKCKNSYECDIEGKRRPKKK